MISVADGWQHGPTVDKGARWEPAEVGAAVRELLAQGAAARARLRRAVSRAGRDRTVAHPGAAPTVQDALARAPACGPTRRCSIGSRAADGAHLAIVDGDVRADGRRPARASSARVAAALVGARRPTGRRRRVAAAELVGSGRVVLGDLALRRDREPDHADACAPARSGSSSGRPARASRSCRARSAAPTIPRCCTSRRSTATVIVVRGDAPLPVGRAAGPTPAVDVDDAGAHPLDVGHDRPIRRASCTRTSRCASRPTRSRPRTTCAPGEPLLLPMPVTHVAGLTYGVLLPVTIGDHRGAHGHLGARARARARSSANASR